MTLPVAVASIPAIAIIRLVNHLEFSQAAIH